MTGRLTRRGKRLLLLHAAAALGLGVLVLLYARGIVVCPV